MVAIIQDIDPLEVFVPHLPPNIRPEWPRKRVYDCRCDFPLGVHPVCVICGIAVGPDHVVKYGGYTEVEVWADTFNERFGYWEVRPQREQRLVCLPCLTYRQEHQKAIKPVRHTSRPMNRLSKVNAWRRRQGLDEVLISTVAADHAYECLVYRSA
jgi:hypothetical protein